MAYDLATLEAARDLAMTAYTVALANPKPDYQVDGQSFNWTQYTRMLREQLEGINKLIASESTGGFEATVVG